MKDKTPLVLIEQVIMILVFSLAAALCLRAFVWADGASSRGEARDQAVLLAEGAAETLKHYHGNYAAAAADWGGSWDGSRWQVDYDGQWRLTADEGAYCLLAVPGAADTDYLGTAELSVSDAAGERLVTLQLAWQEVRSDG